jgi:alpha-D-ribose 1-methylphosphonate 5-triphosphate synthase subunit PhnI
MAYVAARGGEQAIEQAEQLFSRLNGRIDAALVRRIAAQMPYLVDRAMGEGSLYAPELAALALAQSGGDLYEAVLLLRAYRSTQPRLGYAEPVSARHSLVVRRISAAFKDIPGGQLLGPTLDYSHRTLRLDLLDDPRPADEEPEDAPAEASQPPRAPLTPVAEWQRAQGLLEPLPTRAPVDPARLPDVTRDTVALPAPREHVQQLLARADTGGLLALGYASMRGYGLAHPTVNELSLSHAELRVRHPITGAPFCAGRVRVSQCEVISKGEGATMQLGFAATLGWNETKVIAGAMLDLEMAAETPQHPAHSQDFVLYHTEPVEASGFCIHYKLPHYVTFASNLDAVRRAREEGGDGA